MKRTVALSSFNDYALPKELLKLVRFKSMEDPINAEVDWDGTMFSVQLAKDGKKIVIDCTCEESEGACIHAAVVLGALKEAKKASKPELIEPKPASTVKADKVASKTKVGLFSKATKKDAKLRLALFGPSGSGKTFTALRIATGLGGPIAVIDTERGSAAKYASKFNFDVAELGEYDTSNYIDAMIGAIDGGYKVLVIDSISHQWEALKDWVSVIAESKFRGNTWSAWSKGTPKQREFVDAMLRFDGHLIATIRSKTEWTTEKSTNGKTRPVRVGITPEQRGGIEYEFDLLIEMSPEHVGTVLKDRTGELQDQMIKLPGEELGKQLADWLSE